MLDVPQPAAEMELAIPLLNVRTREVKPWEIVLLGNPLSFFHNLKISMVKFLIRSDLESAAFLL